MTEHTYATIALWSELLTRLLFPFARNRILLSKNLEMLFIKRLFVFSFPNMKIAMCDRRAEV